MAKINVSGINLKLDIGKKNNMCKIGIWSAKGGVGKTTISIAIASFFSKKENTALLDADITCPNVAAYLGIEETLVGDKEKGVIFPLKYNNIEIVSMGNIIHSNSVVWRGVMLSKAIEDFIYKVEWKSKNLIIDLPPGTSDVMITMANTIGINNILLLTTPSKLSINELRRSIDFLKKFNINIAGIVENMVSDIYPSIKEKIEEEFGIEVLGSFRYSKDIANAVEKGESIDSLYPEIFSKISSNIKCKD